MGIIGVDTARGSLLGLRRRLSTRFLERAWLASGLALGAAALIWYDRSGYGDAMLVLWLACIAVLGSFFWSISKSLPKPALFDVGIAGGLVLLFAPLYLIRLWEWPVQINSDEVVVADVAQDYGAREGVDPFGISNYLARPAGLFVLWGNLAARLGGDDFFNNVRLLQALFGLLTIAVAYALFRQLLPRWWAVFATALLGVSHAFLMISRLAMRENTSVLVEVAAFALLVWGLRNHHALATFAGGFVAGLGFYVYVPGRAVFPVWAFFLILLAFLYRDRFPLRKLAQLGAIALAGFALMAGPVMIAESKIPPETTPQRDVLMIYPEARQLQQGWVFATSEWEGFKTNISHGLGVFNNNEHDNAWIYENRGHGFVDPLTGILVWVGVAVVGLGLIKRRRDPVDLLVLSGFLALWLSFAFLVNKAPSYPRLLIILPFVAYLVTEAVRYIAGRWRSLRFGPALVTGAAIGVIVVWNVAISWDFVQQGRQNGEAIGSTARYVDTRKDDPGQIFYMATSAGSPYYVWGDEGTALSRIQLFANSPSQVGAAIDPVALRDFNAPAPLSLFMRREVWQTASTELADKYPRGRIRNVTPDGARVVLEVPS